MADDNAELAWRNLVTDWHLKQGMLDCGCDDDTPDGDLCAASREWADAQMANRKDPDLDGPPDEWQHDVWVAAWGHNAPLIVSPNDFRVPMAPAGMSWLINRYLIRGQKVVDIALVRLTESNLVTLARGRVRAEPEVVVAKARALLQGVLD